MSIFTKKQETHEIAMDESKTVNRKRAERLNLALTAGEKALINNGAVKAGLTRTDFILRAVRNEKIILITGLPMVYRGLYKSNNNLNWIAKRLNSHSYVSPKEVLDTVQECRETYRMLMRFIDRWEIRISETEECNDCENEGEQKY